LILPVPDHSQIGSDMLLTVLVRTMVHEGLLAFRHMSAAAAVYDWCTVFERYRVRASKGLRVLSALDRQADTAPEEKDVFASSFRRYLMGRRGGLNAIGNEQFFSIPIPWQ
jgi:hypothetical protein